MALIAAAAVAVGTAAYAGVSAHNAAQRAKGAAHRAAMAMTPKQKERRFNQETADILGEQRSMLENAAAQGNMLSPEVYRALGYEPQYADGGPDLPALGTKHDTAKAEAQAARHRLADLDKQINGLKGHSKQRQALKKEKRTLQASIPNLDRQAALAGRDLATAQTTGRRIVGLTPLKSEDIPDPTGSKNGEYRAAFDLENETLSRALRGEEPIDSTLRRQWDESDIQMREQLRRNLGPDYVTSTAGSVQLAEFDKRKAESFESFNREAIKTFSALTESRAASLSNLTGQRITQMYSPLTMQVNLANSLGNSTGERNAWSQNERGIRTDIAGAKARGEANIVAAKAAETEAWVGLGNSVSSGLSGMGGAGGGGGGGSTSSLSTYLGGDTVSAEAGGVGPTYPNIVSRNL